MERNIHHHKHVGKSLNTNPDGAMAKIARSGFFSRVVINIDDLVQIVNDEGGYAFKFGEVEGGGGASPNDARGGASPNDASFARV